MINHGFRRLALAHSLLSPALRPGAGEPADGVRDDERPERVEPSDHLPREAAPYVGSDT